MTAGGGTGVGAGVAAGASADAAAAGAAAGAVYYLPGIILYMVLAGGKKGLTFPRSALCLTLQMILCQVSIYAWMQLRYEERQWKLPRTRCAM